jgi:hypothetical protein
VVAQVAMVVMHIVERVIRAREINSPRNPLEGQDPEPRRVTEPVEGSTNRKVQVLVGRHQGPESRLRGSTHSGRASVL